MLKKYILISGFASLAALQVSAKTTLRDSIGVENHNGKKLIVHRVEAKETYYAIAKRYQVNFKDIMDFNANRSLQIGSIVKVPTNLPFSNTVASTNTAPVATNNSQPATRYIVQPKDNLGLIARKFNTTIDLLKEWNNLSNNNLSIGQELIVSASSSAVAPVSSVPVSQPEAEHSNYIIHKVQPKEFLNKIAERYNITLEALKAANSLRNNNLKVGQELRIPVRADQGATVATNTAVNTAPAADIRPSTVVDAAGTYTVKPGDNIFSIASSFSLTAYQIRTANNLEDNNLQVGQVLKIPTGGVQKTDAATQPQVVVNIPPSNPEKPKAESPAAATNPTENPNQFTHVVSTGETIFKIAAQYQLTVYQIRMANNLGDNNNIAVGQKLIIPKAPGARSIPEAVAAADDTDLDSTLNEPRLRLAPARYGLNRMDERGTAVWITDPDLDPKKMLILHRTAPIGTVIKITNPMTNKTTFAKVVGKFTENETTKDVIIVITKAVADALGALDKRFLCNLTYGPNDAEQ